MLPHNSEVLEAFFPLFTPPEVQKEFSLWENLVFSFDMDNEQASGSKSSRSRTVSRSESNSATHKDGSVNPSDAQSDTPSIESFAHLVPPVGVAREFDQSYPQFPAVEEHSQRYQDQYFQIRHPQGLPLNPHLLWPQYQDSAAPQTPGPQQMMGISLPGYPYGTLPDTPHLNTGHTTSMPTHGSETSPAVLTSTNSPEADNQTEAEHASSNEEKRRRNTAASARFRIKKKQRTTNLERSVSDLSGRAEELEREAADLRRENGWLKEIVMLKGSRLAGATFDRAANPFLHGLSDFSNKPSSESDESSKHSDEEDTDTEQGPTSGKGKGKEE